MPGQGRTINRWRALATVAVHDLSLARLFEGHADAVAILAELRGPVTDRGQTLGVWAAEARDHRVQLELTPSVRVSGIKRWCSGAGVLTDALVTAWREDAGPYLVAVPLGHAAVRIRPGDWCAVGMSATASSDVEFDSTPAFVREHTPEHADPLRAAHLGAIDMELWRAAAALRSAAGCIDANPRQDARALALRLRAAVEQAALAVLDRAGRALGASAYCLNPKFAKMAADLPVFLRQSHADHDLAVLGGAAKRERAGAWTL